MKITKISIDKFRGFQNVEFNLGSHLTIISGQNGTQKTTLLGLLSQPFTITDKTNPMNVESPLSGGSFKSEFSEKFKLSINFDKIGQHKWTLLFDDNTEYTAGSIDRGGNKKGEIRIWQVNKESGKPIKSKGAGFVQLPVIYLSLKRLLPIGEDNNLNENKSLVLSDDEKKFYADWHNKILILIKDDDKIIDATPLESPQKQTLGANTNYYDWQANSAGQDNIGKILLAILSFKRLKEKYPKIYKGGILAIDEIDTTFYPGSQIKLVRALITFSSQFNIQIIFTTHSLTLLKEVSKYQEDKNRKEQIKLVYLCKKDKKILICKDSNYSFIKAHLNVALTGKPKIKKIIDVFTEDPEGAIFAKSLLGNSRTKYLKFHTDVKLGCGNLIQLASSKVPSFIFPNSIIILDGDIKKPSKIKKIKNILLLPTNKSPEQIIADFLNSLSDDESLWQNIDDTFTKQYCFAEISYQEVQNDRIRAKEWFNSHLNIWGRNVYKVLNPWKQKNKELVDEFTGKFDDLFSKF